MAIKTVMGIESVKGVGAATNFNFKNVGGTPIADPPPNPLDIVCVENTGEVGDGTFYILDAYCRGFGGYTQQQFLIPNDPVAIHSNRESTPDILDASPFLENPNVSTTPVILEGIQEFAII